MFEIKKNNNGNTYHVEEKLNMDIFILIVIQITDTFWSGLTFSTCLWVSRHSNICQYPRKLKTLISFR